MKRNLRSLKNRRATATVEMAIVMTFVLTPMMIGLWEIGRLVHVQQVVSNSTRDGARLAAQGITINQTGAPTQVKTAIDPSANPLSLPNVKASVVQSLRGAGLTNLNWEDVTVTFQFTSTPAGAVVGATEPHQGVKNQRFKVTVTIPFNKVRWVEFGIVNPTTISYTVDWQMLVDDPFNVDTSMPAW